MNSKLAWLCRAGVLTLGFACSSVFAQFLPNPELFMLTWTPPTENTDGTPLTDLAGYVVYVGASPDTLMPVWFVNADRSNMVLQQWSGTRYVAVAAANVEGEVSDLSGILTITVP